MTDRRARCHSAVSSFLATTFLAAALLGVAGCGGSGGSGGAANMAPVADAGDDRVVFKGDFVVLDGADSHDPDGDLIAYRWVQTGGQPVSLDDPTQSRPLFTAPEVGGELLFSLVVSDRKADSAPDEVAIMVQNRAPTAVAGDDIAIEGGGPVTLDGSGSSDPDADALSFDWTQSTGQSVVIDSDGGPIATFAAPPEGGIFEFTLTVTDPEGAASQDTVRASVTPGVIDLPPVVDAGADAEIPKRSDALLVGSASDPENRPLSVEWVQTAGTPTVIFSLDSLATYIQGLPVEADLEFELRVDDGRNVSTDTVVVIVRNQPPEVLDAGLSPDAPGTLNTLSLTPEVVDADADELTLSYAWKVNGIELPDENGNTLASSRFVKGDVVTATVTADDGEATSSLDQSVTILDTPPTLSAEAAPTTVEYGVPVSFRVLANDPDGDPVDDFQLRHGPIGMSVDATGLVTWTPGGPMFKRKLDVNWSVGGGSGAVSGGVQVQDADRKAPLRRSGIEIPLWPDGLEIGDFDNDGDVEALVLSQYSIYELAREPGTYRQRWMYPFRLGDDSQLRAVAAGDVDGDAKSEIFVASGTTLTKLDGRSRLALKTESVPDARYCRDLEFADVDLDGEPELVCLGHDNDFGQSDDGAVYILDARTLQLEWKTPDQFLGPTIAVGNVDTDPALEIVVSGGQIYDGTTREIEWSSVTEFGYLLDAGDIDGDGIDEIVGARGASGGSMRAFDAVIRAQLWQVDVDDVDALTVADVDGDDQEEILLGDWQADDITAWRHNPLGSPSVLFGIDTRESGASTIGVGDLDGDGAAELIWGANAGNTRQNYLFVSGTGPSPAIEWQNEDPAELDGPYLGGLLAQTAPDTTALLFAVAETDDYSAGTRLISMNAQGRFTVTDDLGENRDGGAAVDVADVDANGVDEVLLAASDRPRDGYFAALDINSSVPLWTSPSDVGNGVAVSHADLTGDGVPEFISLTRDGLVKAYDMAEQTLHWQSSDVGNVGVDLVVADLDADGFVEIYAASQDRLARFDYSATADQYVETAFWLIGEIGDLAAGDVDGDGQGELFVLYGGYRDYRSIQRYDSGFLPAGRIDTPWNMHGLFIEDWGGRRKNLLVAIEEDDRHWHLAATLIAIDAVTGSEVWRAPVIPGLISKNSLHYVDVAADGAPEIAFGTSHGMYQTR